MFHGVFTALITPFRQGRVDHEAFRRLVEMQVAAGVDGVVPCGTTGESATLTHEEHKELIRQCIAAAAGRIRVIAGTGSNSTSESVELTRFAKEAGADGALLISPYYNKPTQEGLFRHYSAVAQAVDLPLVLYNVPGRTAVDIKPETVARLSRVPGIAAIKEATGNMEVATSIRLQCGEGMAMLSGDDATFFPFLAVGGNGVISVSTNIAPAPMVDLWRRWQAGDVAGARKRHEELFEINRILFCETNPIPVKAALAMLGLCDEEIRLPLTPLSQANREPVRQAMERLGLFVSG